MAFPDRIERTVELAQPPGVVWAALTTSEGLAGWFGHKADRPAARRLGLDELERGAYCRDAGGAG